MSATTSLSPLNRIFVRIVYVVFGVAGLLLLAAMLLPATQAARESGRVNLRASKAEQVRMLLENHLDASAKHFASVTLDEVAVPSYSGLATAAPGLAFAVNTDPAADLPTAAATGGQAEGRERKSSTPPASAWLSRTLPAWAIKWLPWSSSSTATWPARINRARQANRRSGSWKIRVPVARFDDFVAAAKQLGEVISAGTTSQDVSEEYYDVDARIRNKTKEEERLLKLLEDRPGKLEDVIAIERELSRVREELERMQGRMRVLSDLSSMTTVELSVAEIKNYEPEDAPTLATRVRRSFDASLSALGSTGADLLVLGAALLVWLPILAVLLFAFWIFIRRQFRRSHGSVLRQDVP